MRLWSSIVAVIAVAALACTPAAAPSPTPASAPPAAKPPSDWDQVLEAARREGKVAVAGPPGPESRAALADAFQKKYNIPVEFLAAVPRDLVTRVTTERGAGQFLWDVYVGGSSSAISSLIPAGTFDPLTPALILPEVTNPENWRGRALDFADNSGQVLAMTVRQREILFVNREMVKAEELTSYKDLLDPKWKGKIVMDDPRRNGPGQTTFTFFFLHPELGPEFIRALARQEPTLLKDFRQEADAVGQGRFPILVGSDITAIEPLVKQGVPITIVDPRQLREGSDTSSGNGNVALFKNAPHSNAAKVYINWLLSQEAQAEYVKAVGYISSRVDVPTDFTYAWRVPVSGAIKTYDATGVAVRDPLIPLLVELFGE
jgi:iron(III) transport system substrate-binding protein